MKELPINDKELDTIIELLKYYKPELYSKLWSYKINFLKKEK
jgi:hypothetical protein